MQLVEVEVMRLGLDRSTNSYVVILQEKGGARLLPIWIGQPEAESIVIEATSRWVATARRSPTILALSLPRCALLRFVRRQRP